MAGTVPPAPSSVRLSSITSTSMYAAFTSNGNGSETFIRFELGWGTLGNTPQTVITVDGSTSVNALTPGTTYYFWARGVNAAGTGSWSPRSQATTLRVPYAPDPVLLSFITQTTMRTSFNANGNGGAAVTQWQLGYGTSSSAPQILVTSAGTKDISGLLPATTYYFWARGMNSVGWGPYSARTTARTIAGARVLVGGVWKEAIPYVRVGGVWKIAQPWGKIAGVWKKTG